MLHGGTGSIEVSFRSVLVLVFVSWRGRCLWAWLVVVLLFVLVHLCPVLVVFFVVSAFFFLLFRRLQFFGCCMFSVFLLGLLHFFFVFWCWRFGFF